MLKNNETIEQAASSAPLLTREEEVGLAIAWRRNGDLSAREKLFRSFLRLVLKHARARRSQSHRYHQMVSAGCMGLLVGLDKYDPETGFRVSTYCRFWIRAHISDDINASMEFVKVPSSKTRRGAVMHLDTARRRLGIEHHDRLTHRETLMVADHLRVPTEYVTMADARARGWTVSMDAPDRRKSGDSVISDRLASDAPDPHETLEAKDAAARMTQIVEKCMGVLKPRDRDIFRLRELEDDRTLQDLADVYGLTRERIRQIQAKANERFAKAMHPYRTEMIHLLRAAADRD